MKMIADYIVVGAGLTGAVIARALYDAGESAIVLDRRSHIAGNTFDYIHPSGISIHAYGPHYFRTNDNELWHFVNRFTKFYKYEPAVKSLVDGQYENWPIAGSYILRTVGKGWKPEFSGKPSNFEEAALSLMPRLVYDKFVKGYSEKQWGVRATSLSAGLVKRFDVREDDEPRLMHHKYQGIPVEGYTRMVKAMLDNIPVMLNVDYLKHRESFKPGKLLIFTGPIDEYFDFDLGKLLYRGQKRIHEYYPDVEFVQPCGQINNPNTSTGQHIRSLEWKHMMQPDCARNIRGTVITRELPFTPDSPTDYEYPFPDQANSDLYAKYRERAKELQNVLICGRLGEYRYYDMDQAIARAQMLARRLLGLN